MKTGFEDLDKIMTIRPGEVIVVGARPAMGKSSFLRQIASNVAASPEKPDVWVMDLQNNWRETSVLLLCQVAEVERNKIGPIYRNTDMSAMEAISKQQETEEAKIDGLEYQRLVAASIGPEFTGVRKALTPDDNSLEALFKEKKWPALLLIDTVQMLSLNLESWFEISQTMKRIKARAIKEDCTVILGSDLSRKVEERQGHRPILTDLSDSSALEEIADKILFILRRDYYDPNDKPGLAFIMKAKDNMDSPGQVCLVFQKEIGKYRDYVPVSYELNPAGDDAFSEFAPIKEECTSTV